MRYLENIIYDSKNIMLIKTFRSIAPQGKRIYREHHHTECEVSVIFSGSGVYTLDGGKEYPFTKGDMFLFGSNEVHCITDIHEELKILNIHFEPRILWEDSENIELLRLFSDRNSNFSNKFDHSDTHLKALILDIEQEAINKNSCYKIQAKTKLFSALIHIMRTYDCTGHASALIHDNLTVQKLSEAMMYINSHLESKITLKEISEAACMSQAYFSSVFKKFNGISPWDYITIKRVTKAIHMIKSTDLTILNIAECCGFSSSSNFYKAFVRITGKKPKDYAKDS